MKMTKNSFVRRVVLLLTFTMLFVLVAANAILAEDAPITLSFAFNPDECTVILESSQLLEPVKMENGVAVEIPYGADVKVTVTPKMGYRLLDIKNTETGLSIKQPNLSVYQVGSFLSSLSGEILCETSVFDVVFEIDGVLYEPVSGNMADLTGLKYHYMKPDQLTTLPAVTRKGYEFKYWQVIKSNGEEIYTFPENQTYIPAEIINQDMVNTGKIYLHAVFAAIGQNVIRHDKAYDAEKGVVINHLGTYDQGKLPMDSWASGLTLMGDDGASDDPDNPYLNYKSYVGYKLYTVEGVYKSKRITIPPTDGVNPNTFERYYTPIVYTLVYENLCDGILPENAPTTYTYDAHTPILQPTRRGYTFAGWEVKVDGEIVDAQTNPDFVLGNQGVNNANYAAKDEKIVLSAKWVPNTYNITYVWNVPDALIDSMNEWNAALPKSFTFDQADFLIPNPVRKGYTFTGWVLSYTNGGQIIDAENSGLTAADGKYQLDSTAHIEDITLTASWEVKTYTVNLEGNGATNAFTNAITGVTYDAALIVPEGFVIPTKTGYTFVGYYSVDGSKKYINADGTSNCDVWDIDSENGTVTLVAQWEINYYNVVIEPIQKVPAGVEITVVEVASGTRHAYTDAPISLPYMTEFRVEILMPDGFKIVVWNDAEIGEVHSGNLFISDVIQLGAESITLSAEARPAAPNVGVGYDIDVNITSEREIQVNFTTAEIAKLYEVAISQSSDGSNLIWMQVANGETYYAFTDLNPGTTYFVFIRLRETDSSLSGIPTVKDKTTRYIAYVKEIETILKDMVSSTDGDCVKALVEQTIQDIYDLIPEDGTLPPNFYLLVEEKVAAIEEKIAFARLQDSKIAALQKHLADCMASGSFNRDNKALLNSLCANAVADISAATTVEGIESVYETAMAAMKAVPVTYLYDASGKMQLTTLLGLGQDGSITLNSVEDIKALRRAISDAIAQGKITADTFITLEEAEALLRALDVVSAYSFYLVNVQPVAGDSFEFRMLIPEALAGRTGLQVAYYNAATGMVELLETTVEGNTLVFRAKQVADFVILADPTVDLTGVIIALGVIVLCQLIAIALVLSARSKAKNAVQHASVALPVFLTIYFQPANSELIALALGALALILQIVLMSLLISSGMIRVRKPQKPAPVRQKPAQKPAQKPVAALPEESTTPMGVFVTDEDEMMEEEYAEDEEVLGEDAFDQALAQELAEEQAEEVYDDEEFIEAAPNPYYSLDDEEDAYAYIQEETERVSDVDATNQETEETSYDRDPVEGVFGDAYVQDGTFGDEGAGSYYAKQSTGAYGFADGEDAAQFDAEEFDREETGDEGSLDEAAYLVNDEELSEEEEMYRYDE